MEHSGKLQAFVGLSLSQQWINLINDKLTTAFPVGVSGSHYEA